MQKKPEASLQSLEPHLPPRHKVLCNKQHNPEKKCYTNLGEVGAAPHVYSDALGFLSSTHKPTPLFTSVSVSNPVSVVHWDWDTNPAI